MDRRTAGHGLSVLITVTISFVLSACNGGDNGSSMSSTADYEQTNLVADTAGQAAHVDANLVNAWGIARSPSGPFWIADNHAGVSTIYDGTGTATGPMLVTVPPPAAMPGATSAPTGLVFNSTQDFVVLEGSNFAASLFIFATEDGTISGWNMNVDPSNAILEVDNSATDTIYKGLALGNNADGNFLFATDFHNGKIDVFDGSFSPVTHVGAFVDANIPDGFAPFGVHNINGQLYVTYAKQDANAEDDEKGPGNGYVDVFDTDGNLIHRFASQGTLNSPWGVALAPDNFGRFSNALLVGNFGDGHINAFDTNGTFLGQLSQPNGTPITIDGLWGLIFGNGGSAGSTDTLFFTAGPGDEEHGLFGSLQAVSG